MSIKKIIAKLTTKNIGTQAEAFAKDYLRSHGLTLVTTNYRCRRGEIDLIMTDQASLVFIEVRYRSQDRFGRASETVTPIKQQKLTFTALHYLQHHPQYRHLPCRFDIVGVYPNPQNTTKFTLEWLKNAFQPSA